MNRVAASAGAGSILGAFTARRLGSVRARVAALLLVAAVPVVMLAVFIALQNYRISVDGALQRAALLRAAAAAQNRATLTTVGPVLMRLAADPALLDPARCTARLADALALLPDRFADLLVVDAAGGVRCSVPSGQTDAAPAGTAFGTSDWFTGVRDHGSVRLTEPAGATAAAPLIAAASLHGPGGFAGAVAGWVRIGPPPLPPQGVAHGVVPELWLREATGTPMPLAQARATDLPDATTVARLAASRTGLVLGHSLAGAPFAYASAPISTDLNLLVATTAEMDIAAARLTLAHRLTGLVLLLGLGLAAVAVGADRAVIQPIRRLAAAVGSWRAGAPFDAGPLGGLPSEVKELASSFAAAAAALARREQELREAAAQHQLLMREIHHRVKNNLQIVASLLNLQAGRIRLPQAKREFAAARDRVRALATLHRHLYADGDLRTIDMSVFLRELCEQLLHAIGEPTGTRIVLDIEAPALEFDSDQAVPIALIVTEAVSNAAKHAFPNQRSGRIRVALSLDGTLVRLVIQDDGIGLTAADAAMDDEGRAGIGMHLIRGFARQLGAELIVTDENGLRYELVLDMSRQRLARETEPASI